MTNKKCKHCGETIRNSYHHCSKTNRTYREDDTGDFALSAIVAYATDSAILGGLVGGDIGGAILGDLFNGGDLFD